MNLPEDLLYHREHTWARIQGAVITVGITDHAQKELGDVVFVELPAVGRRVLAGEVFGSVESSKSVSELFSPVTGEVIEVNGVLEDEPQEINSDPYGAGWMIRVQLAPGFIPTGLLGAQAYRQLIEA